MRSGHFVTLGVNWAIPLLLVAMCAVFIQLMQRFFNEKLSKIGFGMNRKQMQVDEDLPNFFSVVKLEDREKMIKMYDNMKVNFGFETTDPDTIKSLKDAPYPEYTMVGTPWY